jgi:formate dehydrogenase subunit gamma
LKTSVIPANRVPLGAEEAEAMRQRLFKKHHLAIILLHWFNAAVWFLELATGLALISSPLFRLAPAWYVEMVHGVFGTRGQLLTFHVMLGLAWIAVYLVYGVFGFRTYLSREVLQNEIALDQDDWRWLVVRVEGILGLTREPLPPQGVYNAGQKLFALMVYAIVPVVMLTGIIMAFRLWGPSLVGWAIVLHFGAVGAVVSGLLVHVYMGAVFPEEKPAFFSMITGTVDELYAYNHHFKWWASMQAKQRAWERRHDEEAGLSASSSTEAGA